MPKKPKPKAETSVQMSVPQPHGGALVPGGTGAGGRPKEVLRRRCREAIEGDGITMHGVAFVAGVMRGTETEDVTVTVRQGKDLITTVEKVRPKLRDRLLAFELLADRGYGKPEQGITVEDERPRRTGAESEARILELLPRALALLPLDRQAIARLVAQRREIEVLVRGKTIPGGAGDRSAQR